MRSFDVTPFSDCGSAVSSPRHPPLISAVGLLSDVR